MCFRDVFEEHPRVPAPAAVPPPSWYLESHMWSYTFMLLACRLAPGPGHGVLQLPGLSADLVPGAALQRRLAAEEHRRGIKAFSCLDQLLASGRDGVVV